jgi:hypothetical protein
MTVSLSAKNLVCASVAGCSKDPRYIPREDDLIHSQFSRVACELRSERGAAKRRRRSAAIWVRELEGSF